MTDAVENTEAPPAASAPPAAPRGNTTIDGEVVEKIAAGAAREVPGVAELGGDVARFFNDVLDRIGLDKAGDADRGVSAQVKDGTAVINVVIVIAAGHVVHEVTDAVRAKVIEAVERYGLQVTQVNIKVDDIELDQPAAGV